jgi:hypothetical protein
MILGLSSPTNRAQRKGTECLPEKTRGFNPQAKYTDRAAATFWRSKVQLMQVENVEWSAQRVLTPFNLGF